MKIAAVLPHMEVYGGVRRYLEIGNEMVKRGHEFVIFTPQGEKPDWLDFKGLMRAFGSFDEESFDVGLCSEYSMLTDFERLKARVKFFYFVLEGHKKESEVVKKNYLFLGNSEGICRRIEKKYRVSCQRAVGGVNPDLFYPIAREEKRNETRILCYGRVYKKRKGVRRVIRAVERLYKRFPNLRLVFFDSLVGEDRRDPRLMIRTRVPYDFYLNLPQSKMAWLFSQADIFVSAERRAGWSNTTAEAMACRLPVVCTRSGTRDFAVDRQTALVVPFPHYLLLSFQIKRLIKDAELCSRLARAGYERIKLFSWSALTDKLERVFMEKAKLK
jgi:glycosyltransferase involved in cell wall biosynthesis